MQLTELEGHRHSIATRSGKISYIDVGPERTGPAALFVHGVATNAYLWRNVIGALSGQRRCVALDLPLHGQSPVQAGQDLSVAALAAGLEDFCEALGLTGIDLVANDTGGAVAQVFAARHPERLASFTLTNCDTAGNLPPEDFKPTVELARAGDLAPTAVALFADLDAAAKVAFGNGYEHLDRVDPAVIRSYLEPCFGSLERAREFERLLAAMDDADLEAVTPRLRELTVPTLIVWGTGDAFFDVSWAYWLRDTIPGTTRVVTVDGARLFFPDERAMDLVPHLEQHWAAAAVKA
ncbi:MAG TPA: alpha/beta hydrolase [Streptosporangiaceae bacterium]